LVTADLAVSYEASPPATRPWWPVLALTSTLGAAVTVKAALAVRWGTT
jgi:hypothetical protein